MEIAAKDHRQIDLVSLFCTETGARKRKALQRSGAVLQLNSVECEEDLPDPERPVITVKRRGVSLR